MKSKYLFLVAWLFIMSHVAFGQTEKGHKLVGGSFNIGSLSTSSGSSDNIFFLSIAPNIAFFIADNVAIGGALGIDLSDSDNASSTSISISPMGRYYFGDSEKTKWFGTGTLGFVSSKTETLGFEVTRSGITGHLGVGLAYFLNEFVSIEGVFGYRFTKFEDLDAVSRTGLDVGLQIYLP
ncbi:outer membrane beta-barrel protein [Fulvivirgaceae bacterium BMA10]|uniref:Outer membrane beta-barrel protein n=1 Tax=Splendidivirga corallicola TaxID=3051826 RepID=A0ABT8KKW7_9BACT|nr:outer membrane beta-barrel protein [Fulvivirgaceae bacterium BMA10]